LTNVCCIGGVIVTMLAMTVVDCGFETPSVQNKEYEICICCFSKHTALSNKNKDWLGTEFR